MLGREAGRRRVVIMWGHNDAKRLTARARRFPTRQNSQLFHDARAMNDSIESNEVSAASLHCDIFESGADCRSRSPMRLLNRGISREAEPAHSLWFEQFRTIRLTRPKTGILECAPPDTDTELDYQQGVEILEELGYAVTVCTRFPSDLCGDAVHKDRFYALASLSPGAWCRRSHLP